MPDSHAHLIGIGGNGMRALADVLHGWGWSISGSDASFSTNSTMNFGVAEEERRVFYPGHSANNLPVKTDLVVHSDAILPENPELLRAAELGIPILSYFQTVGEITRRTGFQPVKITPEASLSRTLAVAGTHGKSTTTAIIAHILTKAGRDPTVFCGAAPLGEISGGRAGRREFFVVEACEYRKNFLYLRPHHAALLGIEPDHFDCYENLAAIEAAFRQFAESVPPDGLLLYREDCPTTRKVVQNLDCRRLSFGLSPAADWSARCISHEEGYYRFSIFKRREQILEVQLPVPGEYNILNALAAGAMCWENGCSAEEIHLGLTTFPGLHRRFEIGRTGFQAIAKLAERGFCQCEGTGRNFTIFNGSAGASPSRSDKPVHHLSYVADYAHHPTEVMAALKTAREVFPKRRIWCIFQPHQASRTARLLDELAVSLQNADKIIVAEIFRAREGKPRLGEVTAGDLARRAAEVARAGKTGAEVVPVHQTDDIMDILATQLQADDVLIALGAGDIHQWFC
jgi:UDP-N-acetylmuramate--alanine ligase